MTHHSIQQIPDISSMLSGHQDRLPQTQAVKVNRGLPGVQGTFDFVYTQHHRLFVAPQDITYLFIYAGKAGPAVYHKDDYVSLFHGDHGLHANLPCNHVIFRIYTACVNHGKMLVDPLTLAVNAIAGNTRLSFHNGSPGFGYSVKQGALAYIRPAHYGDNRFAHLISPWLRSILALIVSLSAMVFLPPESVQCFTMM